MVDKQQLAAMGEHMREMEECRPEFKVPDGWKLVPVEPEFAMLAADGCKEHHDGQECNFHKNRRRIWSAMLSAAPEYKP